MDEQSEVFSLDSSIEIEDLPCMNEIHQVLEIDCSDFNEDTQSYVVCPHMDNFSQHLLAAVNEGFRGKALAEKLVELTQKKFDELVLNRNASEAMACHFSMTTVFNVELERDEHQFHLTCDDCERRVVTNCTIQPKVTYVQPPHMKEKSDDCSVLLRETVTKLHEG